MKLKTYKTKEAFCKDNLKLLEKEEALNNIMIAVILDAKEEEVENWLLARVENDSKIEMIIIINKPKNGLLMYSPTKNYSDEISEFIASEINKLDIDLLEINSRKQLCENVAKYYTKLNGKKIKSKKDKYILELTKLEEIPINEKLELVKIENENCIEEICDNIKEFQEEAHKKVITNDEAREHANIHMKKGLYVFKNDKGEIVLQAMTSRKLINGYVIGAVVTPKKYRGKGYGKIGMYILSNKLLNDGAKVLALYTDAKNEISNHVYEKVGYKRISEELLISFE